MMFPHAPAAGELRSSGFWIGTYNDVANGPLTFEFSRDIKGFAMDLRGIQMAGHYLVAYNAAGAEVGRADFVVDPVDNQDAQTIVANGIRKVVYYFPLGSCAPSGCAELNPTEHDVAFDADPAPQPQLCNIPTDASHPEYTDPFNDVQVRRAMEDMLFRSDTISAMTQRHEEYRYVRRNQDGTYRVDPVPNSDLTRLNHCETSVTIPPSSSILGVVHTHPMRENDYPLCPGAGVNEPYAGPANDGLSEKDYVHKLITNHIRASVNLNQLPLYVIDLDYAYYSHPNSVQHDAANRRIIRTAGRTGGGCKWVY